MSSATTGGRRQEVAPSAEVGEELYAARSGQTEEEYTRRFGEPLTPQAAGAAVVELVEAYATTLEPACLLTSAVSSDSP